MTQKTARESTSQPAERGTGLLFWGLVTVASVNLAMVLVALAMFAP